MGLKLSEGIIWTTQDQFISKNQKNFDFDFH